MTEEFNSYKRYQFVEFWQTLCESEGEMRHYERGDYFFREGEVARFIGFIRSGTLKYVAYDDEGTEHVMGFEFTEGFVTDFPFSLHGQKARTSVIATSTCEIMCIPTHIIKGRLERDTMLQKMVAEATEVVFGMVYDRYKALYTLSPQQRYLDLISKHPDLFSMFSLRDIASFLKVTPTHLSRLRKNF